MADDFVRPAGTALWEDKEPLLDTRLASARLDEVKIIGKKGEKILVWKNYPTGAKPVWITLKNLDIHKPDLMDPPPGTEDEYPAVGDLGDGDDVVPLPGQDKVPEMTGWVPSVKLKNLAKKVLDLGLEPQNTFSKAIAAGEPLPTVIPEPAGVDHLPKKPAEAPPPVEPPAGEEPPKEPEKAEPPPEQAMPAPEVPTLDDGEFQAALATKDAEALGKHAGTFTSSQADKLADYVINSENGFMLPDTGVLAAKALAKHFYKLAATTEDPASSKQNKHYGDSWEAKAVALEKEQEKQKPKPVVKDPVPPPEPEPAPENIEPDLVFSFKMKPPKDWKVPGFGTAKVQANAWGLKDNEFVHPGNQEIFKINDLGKNEYVDPKTGIVIDISTGAPAKGSKSISPSGKVLSQPSFDAPPSAAPAPVPAPSKAPPEVAPPKPEPPEAVTPSKVTPADVPPPTPPAEPEPVKTTKSKKAALKIKPPAELPAAKDLKLVGSGNSLGGAGDKTIYEDDKGQKWLHKAAYQKGGSAAKPYAAAAQQVWADIARFIDSEHLPVGVLEVNKKFGTLQPLIDLDPAQPNLKNVGTETLSDEDRVTIAREHVMDWLMSQHDSHSANFVRRKDGKIFSVDKEQGFRFFGSDKLSVDYKPNSDLYGENPPYYNELWKKAADGKYDMDKLADSVKATIEKIESMSTGDYMKKLRPYVESFYPDKPAEQAKLLKQIRKRKLDLRKDFEVFLTGLYRKKESTDKGAYTLDKGWVSSAAGPKVVKKKKTFKLDDAGKENSALTKAGSGWNVNLPGFEGVVLRPYHDPTNPSQSDENKITIKAPVSDLNAVEKIKNFMDKLGLKPLVNPLSSDSSHIKGSQYVMMFASKKDFEAAGIEYEETVEPQDISPTPSSARYHPDDYEHNPTTNNANELKHMASTTLGYGGKRYSSDGPAVEGSTKKIKRYVDSSGDSYHYVTFKLRPHMWKDLATEGKAGSFGFPLASYDAKNDSFTEIGGFSDSVTTRVWKVGNSEVHLATGKQKYAYMGGVHMKIRPKKGQSHEEAVAELLDAMKPGLSKQVLRDPTPEEKETHRLSQLLWASAPQVSDNLAEGDRNPAKLKELLAKHGISEKDIENTTHEEVFPGYATHVQKDRWKKLAGGKFKFGFNGVNSISSVINILQHGLMGIGDRNQSGIAKFGASYEADVESGSADGILLRPVTDSGTKNSFQNHPFAGVAQVIVHPGEYDRLDAYQHNSDKFGRCRDDSGDWTARKSFTDTMAAQQKNYATGAETSFRKGIRPERILRVCVSNESQRKDAIKQAKGAGLQEVNGVPIEDFIVVETSCKDAWEKYVKPVVEEDK
jgi:hypothetical protein